MLAPGFHTQIKSFKCFLVQLSLKIKQHLKGQMGSIQWPLGLNHTNATKVFVSKKEREGEIFPIPFSLFILWQHTAFFFMLVSKNTFISLFFSLLASFTSICKSHEICAHCDLHQFCKRKKNKNHLLFLFNVESHLLRLSHSLHIDRFFPFSAHLIPRSPAPHACECQRCICDLCTLTSAAFQMLARLRRRKPWK